MGRGKFSDARYEEIKKEIVFMYEECGINSCPINCYQIARTLHYTLRPYSTLSKKDYLDAICHSNDAFSRVEKNPISKLFEYVIYYNDRDFTEGHIRWSIMHEIGHCYLGHHDNPPGNEQREEDEADFFAKYAMSPPPLLYATHCTCASDVEQLFM